MYIICIFRVLFVKIKNMFLYLYIIVSYPLDSSHRFLLWHHLWYSRGMKT